MSVQGMSARQGALIAGLGLLLMLPCAPVAQFVIFPQLIAPGDAAQTMQNIRGNPMLFVAGAGAYLLTAILDLFVAWGLYILFAQANKALSLMAMILRLIYAATYFGAIFNLANAYRLITDPRYTELLGESGVAAQAVILIDQFQCEWGLGLGLFGLHLLVLGYLAFRAGYVPKLLGVLLAIAGLGYVAHTVGAYALPNVDLSFVFATFLGELAFMIWLLVFGWRIKTPAAS